MSHRLSPWVPRNYSFLATNRITADIAGIVGLDHEMVLNSLAPAGAEPAPYDEVYRNVECD
jgi:hypothetical protein